MKKYIALFMIISGLILAQNSAAYELGNVDIHGFISQGFMQSDTYDYFARTDKPTTSEGTFELNEMGINFSSSLTDELRLGIQLFAMDLGDYGNDELVVDWAYGDYRVNNYLGIRAGKFKIAHGLHNEVKDIDSVRTFVFLPRAIYYPGMRDLFGGMKGVSLYGELPYGVSYQGGYGLVQVTTEAKIVDDLKDTSTATAKISVYDAFAPIIGAAGANMVIENSTIAFDITDSDTHNTKNLALRWSPPKLDGLRLSGTYYGSEAEFTTDFAGTTVTVPDAVIAGAQAQAAAAAAQAAADAGITDPATIAGIVAQAEATAEALLVGGADATTAALLSKTTMKFNEISTTVFSAEYTFGNTVLFGEYNKIKIDVEGQPTIDETGWSAGASHRFTDWFELGAYYSDYNTDDDDRDGKELEKVGIPKEERYLRDACLATRFDINEYWTVKLEGHAMDGLYRINWRSHTDPGEDPDPNWYLFAAKASYSF